MEKIVDMMPEMKIISVVRWGRAVAQADSRRLPTPAVLVLAQTNDIGFMVVKAAMEDVFSEYF
jgi:hypothetical protein